MSNVIFQKEKEVEGTDMGDARASSSRTESEPWSLLSTGMCIINNNKIKELNTRQNEGWKGGRALFRNHVIQESK